MDKRGRTPFIVAFLAPAVLIYGGLVLVPLIQAFQFSTYSWRGVSLNRKFVGLGNFQELWKDDAFWRALQNNLWLLAGVGLAGLALAVALAHGMQGTSRVSRTLRSVVLLPQMTSLVVVAILWTFVYNPQFGLLTSGMKGLGLGRFVHTWLGERTTALPAVGVSLVWYVVGFYVMLFAAGLKAISPEVREAAELDGAVGMRRFWRVTWPLLWSIKRIAVVHVTITVMNVFALVYLMTQGGPDRATEVMLTYLYESAFENTKFGYATTIAVANFFVVMGLSVAILFAFRRDPTEGRP